MAKISSEFQFNSVILLSFPRNKFDFGNMKISRLPFLSPPILFFSMTFYFCLLFLSTTLSATEVYSKNGWTNLVLPVSDSLVFTQIPSTWEKTPAFNSFLKKREMHLIGFYPKGQSPENWTEMINILGQKRGEFTMEQYFNLMIQKRVKSCSKKNTSAEVIKKTSEMLTGIIYCGGVIAESKNSTLAKKGQGEISAYRILKKGGYLFPIIRVWRGKEFIYTDPDEKNFPATKKTITEYFLASATTQICKNKNPQNPCSNYNNQSPKDAAGPSIASKPSVITTHSVKQAFKIPLSKGIEEEKENPGWINILFPAHDKFVLTQIPEKWGLEPAHEQLNGPVHTLSFYPKGQDKNNWSERMKFNSYREITATPASLFQTTYEWLGIICEKENIAAIPVNKSKDKLVAIIMCGKVIKENSGLKKDSGLLSVDTIISNDDTFYSLNYSWTGEIFNVHEKTDEGLPASAKKIANYIKTSKSTLICNRMNPNSPCNNFAIAEERGPKTTNLNTWGNLQSYNPIDCEDIEKITNKHTPADIYKGLSKCLEQQNYKKGVYLHALAGTYAYFDKLRVKDKSAHNAYPILLRQSLNLAGPSTDPFKSELKNMMDQKVEISKVCAKIKNLGAPDYYPSYMVQHGMQAVNGESTNNGLVINFNPTTAWETSLEKFVKCPHN